MASLKAQATFRPISSRSDHTDQLLILRILPHLHSCSPSLLVVLEQSLLNDGGRHSGLKRASCGLFAAKGDQIPPCLLAKVGFAYIWQVTRLLP